MATSGKFLKATVGGVVLFKGVKRWECDDSAGDDLDNTTADSNGYEDTETGVKALRVTIEGVWDTANGPFPTMRKGTVFTDLRCYALSTQSTPDFYCPFAIATGQPRTVEVRGQITYRIMLRNKGRYQIDGTDA